MAKVSNGARLWRVLAFCACVAAVSIQTVGAPALLRTEGLPVPNLMTRRVSLPQGAEQARQTLRNLIGAADLRVLGPVSKEKVAELADYEALAIRWPVFDKVHGEGLWLKAKRRPRVLVLAIPDAEQTPEMVAGLAPGVKPEMQFARRLAENGCDVVVPVLIRRAQRDEVCREALEAQRHIVGYEVQKALAAVDWLKQEYPDVPVSIVGYGEGGLIALCAAALDTRIEATLVCGYFDQHRSEPLSRRLPALAGGDAEVASLIAPRALLVEYSMGPALAGEVGKRRVEPDYETVMGEFERARTLDIGGATSTERFAFLCGNEGMLTGPAGEMALTALLRESGLSIEMKEPAPAIEEPRFAFDPEQRQKRQREELLDYSRQIIFLRHAPPLWPW